jgi:hypothetical protein
VYVADASMRSISSSKFRDMMSCWWGTTAAIGGENLLLVIKEALWLQRPVPLLIPRECWTPCRVLRFDVPVGVMILVNTWAIGRNSRH